MRTGDGAVPRTRVAVLMGLTAALLQPQNIACGGGVDDQRNPWSDGGNGGDGNIGSAYGVGPSTGGFGGDGAIGSAYGVGPSTGGFGAGGEGGFGEGGVGEGGVGEGGVAEGGAEQGGDQNGGGGG